VGIHRPSLLTYLKGRTKYGQHYPSQEVVMRVTWLHYVELCN